MTALRKLTCALALSGLLALPQMAHAQLGGIITGQDVDRVAESVERRCEERIAGAVSRALDEWTTKHPPQKGEDGVGMAGGMIDREGDLIITTSKGETLRLGRVVGKDGADFTNVEIDYDGERTLIIRGQGGEIRKHLPIPIDRGYWRDGKIGRAHV